MATTAEVTAEVIELDEDAHHASTACHSTRKRCETPPEPYASAFAALSAHSHHSPPVSPVGRTSTAAAARPPPSSRKQAKAPNITSNSDTLATDKWAGIIVGDPNKVQKLSALVTETFELGDPDLVCEAFHKRIAKSASCWAPICG